MNKKYCKCGHVNEYSYSVPKFCSGCGSPFTAIRVEASTAPQRESRRERPAVEDSYHEDDNRFEDDRDYNDFRSLKQGLRASIEDNSMGNAKYKMEDIVKQEKTGVTRDKPGPSDVDVMQEMKDICSRTHVE